MQGKPRASPKKASATARPASDPLATQDDPAKSLTQETAADETTTCAVGHNQIVRTGVQAQQHKRADVYILELVDERRFTDGVVYLRYRKRV